MSESPGKTLQMLDWALAFKSGVRSANHRLEFLKQTLLLNLAGAISELHFHSQAL